MKFIHASDFHLCSSFINSAIPAEIAEAHRNQLWKSFQNIIDICAKDNIDILLISGDLFEAEYAKISDIKRIADAFATIPETKVIISCGNHDPNSENSYYRLIAFPSNVFIFPSEFSNIDLPEFNTVIYGFSWNINKYAETPFDLPVLDKNKINFLSLHCDAVNRSVYMPIKAEVIDGVGFDYVALGHIHKATHLMNNIFYCGSPEPLDFGEEGKHGYFLGELNDEKLTVKFVKSAHREFVTKKIKLNGQMDHNEIKKVVLQECADGFQKNIYRIKFTGMISPEVRISSVIDDISDQFYCLMVQDETLPDYDIKKLYSENRDNIIGKFIESLMDKAATDIIAYKALIAGLNAMLQQRGGM